MRPLLHENPYPLEEVLNDLPKPFVDVSYTHLDVYKRQLHAIATAHHTPEQIAAMAANAVTTDRYYAARSAYELAEKMKVEMPITREAYAILYEGRDPRQAMQMLMTREKRHEFEDAGWN